MKKKIPKELQNKYPLFFPEPKWYVKFPFILYIIINLHLFFPPLISPKKANSAIKLIKYVAIKTVLFTLKTINQEGKKSMGITQTKN